MNPNSGRFWTMDTFEGGNGDPMTLHKYAFGNSNPINNTDPSGRQTLNSQIGNLLIAAVILTAPLSIWAFRSASSMTVPPGDFIPVDPTKLHVLYHSVVLHNVSAGNFPSPEDRVFALVAKLSSLDLTPAKALNDVSGVGSEVTFHMQFEILQYGQADFPVRITQYDANQHFMVARTLAGHPLAAWRKWSVTRTNSNDLLVETFSVEHPYSVFDDLKMGPMQGQSGMDWTWNSMLLDIAAKSGGTIVRAQSDLVGVPRNNVQDYYNQVK